MCPNSPIAKKSSICLLEKDVYAHQSGTHLGVDLLGHSLDKDIFSLICQMVFPKWLHQFAQCQ